MIREISKEEQLENVIAAAEECIHRKTEDVSARNGQSLITSVSS